MEHVEPPSRGGEDAAENIVPACLPCNSSKSNLFLLEWVAVRRGFCGRQRMQEFGRSHAREWWAAELVRLRAA